MKPNTGSKQTHISWFMPIGVFIDLFAAAVDMHMTSTMFVFKRITDKLCETLMDGGWDTKIVIGADVVKCTVHRPSLVFRYHIGRSTLYANFQYNRQRMVSELVWEAIDKFEPVGMVSIHCEVGEWRLDLDVGSSWSLADLRQEILIQLGSDPDANLEMWVIEAENTPVKVNARNEKNMLVQSVLPPKMVRLLART